LKRKKRKKTEERNGRCPEHGEEYCFYCMEDAELLCFVCASIPTHTRHNLEAFDVAQKQVESKLKSQLGTLEGKRAKLEAFVDNVKKQQQNLKEATEKTAQDAKEKIANLRKLLEEKEKEFDESLKRIELSKKHTIDTELKKAQERMNKIDESITMVSEAMGTKTPLEFLIKTEEAEETMRHTVLAADLELKQRWFEMPQLFTQHVEQQVKNLKFADRRHGQYPLSTVMGDSITGCYSIAMESPIQSIMLRGLHK
jgi:septal ring factor EnvC (AmiA/AmiB activator)